MTKEINTYVMCSTLNQMVNYLPLSVFFKENEENIKIKKIYNITIEGENEKGSEKKRFHNEKWDENFENVKKNNPNLHNIEIFDIPIKRNESLSIKEVYGSIDKKLSEDDKKNPILWNITGGQRNLLMGIYKLIEERKKLGDKILYLEGNSNKMMILEDSDNKDDGRSLSCKKYFDENLDIETALNLIGLRTKENGQVKKRKNLLKTGIDKYKEYLDLYNLYVGENSKNSKNSDKKFKEFRNIILRLNKKKNGTGWKEVEKYIDKNFNDSQYEKKKGSIKKIGEEVENISNPLGHILEYMTVAVILDCLNKNRELKDYFVDMSHSCNIYFRDDKYYIKSPKNSLFEFDITLLSGSGQFVIFECKSGVMLGETAKARKYSVYAAGGVYGKPVIITPLLKSQIIKIKNEINEAKYDLGDDENVYSTLKQTINSAVRADMEVWGIDEVGCKLKQLFKDALEG